VSNFTQNRIIRSFGQSLIWTAGNAVFGLIQVWLALLLARALKNNPFSINNVLYDGVFLIFSSILVCSVLFDTYFAKNIKMSNLSKCILHFVFPFGIIILSLATYLVLRLNIIVELQYDNISLLTAMALIGGVIYALIIKCLLFYVKPKRHRHEPAGSE
jgi:hypothetical protein